MSGQPAGKRTLLSRLTVNPAVNFVFGEPTEYEMQPVSKAELWGFRITAALIASGVLGLAVHYLGR